MASGKVLGSLLEQIGPGVSSPRAKITVVGVGQVGMAAAYSIMLQHVASEIALVDIDDKRLKGEMMDLQHGQAFRHLITIRASSDYAVSKNSTVCVVTAGARQAEGETRLQLVQKNVGIFKNIIPQLIKYSPDTILVIVTNPVDILTWLAWKISGLPRERVIGSGTMLDSARLRFLMGQKLGLAASSCHGYIIGEHGDSSVAVWSSANVAGARLRDLNPKAGDADDPEEWGKLHAEVISSAYEIIKLKGYTSWAIGSMVGTLCYSIVKNERKVYTLSTMAKGQYGITNDVFLSVPCIIGERGITHIVKQILTKKEIEQLMKSATALGDITSKLKI